MSRTLFANKPAPCREIDRIGRRHPHAAARDGARRLRDARGGHAPDADAGGWAGGDYARYARDSALDVYENNYTNMILSMQNERAVARYVESAEQAEP